MLVGRQSCGAGDGKFAGFTPGFVTRAHEDHVDPVARGSLAAIKADVDVQAIFEVAGRDDLSGRDIGHDVLELNTFRLERVPACDDRNIGFRQSRCVARHPHPHGAEGEIKGRAGQEIAQERGKQHDPHRGADDRREHMTRRHSPGGVVVRPQHQNIVRQPGLKPLPPAGGLVRVDFLQLALLFDVFHGFRRYDQNRHTGKSADCEQARRPPSVPFFRTHDFPPCVKNRYILKVRRENYSK